MERISPSLAERSCLVDIQLAFNSPVEAREDVILRMFNAGYKLRGDTLNTLTFLKEFD